MKSEITEVSVAVPYSSEEEKFLVSKNNRISNGNAWSFPAFRVKEENEKETAILGLKENEGLTGEVVKKGEKFEFEIDNRKYRFIPLLILVDAQEVDEGNKDLNWTNLENLEDLETHEDVSKHLESLGVNGL